jgi:hypothetical protein
MTQEEPRPYVAGNGNRFTASQAKLITEHLRYEPSEDSAVVRVACWTCDDCQDPTHEGRNAI